MTEHERNNSEQPERKSPPTAPPIPNRESPPTPTREIPRDPPLPDAIEPDKDWDRS